MLPSTGHGDWGTFLRWTVSFFFHSLRVAPIALKRFCKSRRPKRTPLPIGFATSNHELDTCWRMKVTSRHSKMSLISIRSVWTEYDRWLLRIQTAFWKTVGVISSMQSMQFLQGKTVSDRGGEKGLRFFSCKSESPPRTWIGVWGSSDSTRCGKNTFERP